MEEIQQVENPQQPNKSIEDFENTSKAFDILLKKLEESLKATRELANRRKKLLEDIQKNISDIDKIEKNCIADLECSKNKKVKKEIEDTKLMIRDSKKKLIKTAAEDDSRIKGKSRTNMQDIFLGVRATLLGLEEFMQNASEPDKQKALLLKNTLVGYLDRILELQNSL